MWPVRRLLPRARKDFAPFVAAASSAAGEVQAAPDLVLAWGGAVKTGTVVVLDFNFPDSAWC